MLKLTDNAIERLTQIAKDHGRRYCRLSVKGGGCAGFEYEWSTCNEEEKGDIVLKDVLVVNRDFELYLCHPFSHQLLYLYFSDYRL